MITIEPPSTSSIPAATLLTLSKPGLARFVNLVRARIGLSGTVEVLLTGDAEMKRLNRTFRGKNKATDVLSFPAPSEPAHGHAGDLAISLETAARQAAAYGHSLRDEVRILLLHGLLHLHGLDHETDTGEMAAREAALRHELRLPVTLIDPCPCTCKAQGPRMSPVFILTSIVLLAVLTLAAYVDRVYSEMGKFLAREYQDNIDAWEQVVEPRLRLGRESVALSASVLRQLSLAAIALLSGLRLYSHPALSQAAAQPLAITPTLPEVLRTAFELVLLILVFDRLVPQVLFTRTQGVWISKILYLLEALFYLILPITLLLGLILSIAALAEPEDKQEADHPSEAMDALLEAGEEEGILEESDRELVRSAVEFGDKVVREVMTPRPEIFAVPGTMTLQQFTALLAEHAFSRVPVYSDSLDTITGIAFAHDLLQVRDTDAETITVAAMQRPAAFVPETKKVAELLREMQREKQHMRLVIDEYGGVAGLVTIEDLLEAIVGSIADEHDEPEDDDAPIREPDGTYSVSGSFELSRLRDLFSDQIEPHRAARTAEEGERPPSEEDDRSRPDHDTREELATAAGLRLPEHYESTTLGGLVSEIAGHIPLPGEVVEEEGLRLEVLASTDRRIDRIRVSLAPEAAS